MALESSNIIYKKQTNGNYSSKTTLEWNLKETCREFKFDNLTGSHRYMIIWSEKKVKWSFVSQFYILQ